MDERARRIGHNEALFREVNERVKALTDEFDAADEPMEIMCECGDRSCRESLVISVPEYEALRADSTRFATAPGHELPDVERVVEDRGAYVVVEKDAGAPAQIADELDPRS